ncbi:hypothetical protein C1A40_16895 [Tamlana carrageenivorans]|uniref:Uncharacterized protein n=2 Tax=Pseudotamlana carrageenivorans TaxID=2069432 RepID=A0A2I7SM88_9FLAO|nr:hypothetical protein C1A40_16895 [Tamlana carrageenivorans]
MFEVNSQTIALSDTYISQHQNYINTTSRDLISKHIKDVESHLITSNYTADLEDLCDDENDLYTVSFYTSSGKIEAAYNKKGKLIKTHERYKNNRLPLEVMQAISKNYPDWCIIEGLHFIKYHHENDTLNQVYKIKIKKESEILSLKTNEIGKFL